MTSLPHFDLDGLVIGVTGGGKGIGQAIVLRAVESGARVFTCSRTVADLRTLADAAADLQGELATLALDITSDESPRQFLDFGVQSFGHVDAVINNVGRNFAKPAVDYTPSELDELFTINLRSLYLTCTATAEIMMSEGVRGSIVNISSKAAIVASPLRTPYGAMKAAVNQLTRSFAAEWGESGIRVNAIAPGATATPLFSDTRSSLPEQDVLRRILLGHRPLTPDEIALPALFLASPASSMMTGQVLAVDGGASLV